MLEVQLTMQEYSKKSFVFSNDEEGSMAFKFWIEYIAEKNGKDKVILGMEPTGHYWFNLGMFLQKNKMRLVHVNLHHVKKSKQLDDNNPNKNDRKDPKTIAALVNEGRFMYPYIPTGIYAEIRNLSIQGYKAVYGKLDSISGMMILKYVPLPENIVKFGVEGVNKIWRDAKLRAVEYKRVKTLVNMAEHRVSKRLLLYNTRC